MEKKHDITFNFGLTSDKRSIELHRKPLGRVFSFLPFYMECIMGTDFV